MPDLGGIQPDAGNQVTVGQGLIQGALGILLAQMTQKTQDQPVREPPGALGVCQRAVDAREHVGKGDAARGMGLRIEEDLRMDHAIDPCALQISPRHRVEVGFLAQHVGAGIIKVEKRLQIVKVIGLAECTD